MVVGAGSETEYQQSVRVGRYAKWKYLMTHDCVSKAKNEAENGVKLV
jgi:hypothetical protein